MWKFAGQAFGWLQNKIYDARHGASGDHEFVGAPMPTDTVVFVHGLHGHRSKTWKLFPTLLEGDRDLPRLDVMLWGYRATVFAGAEPLQEVAKMLMSAARDLTSNESDLFFVGHSMGGLVVLQGLCHEAKSGRAQQRPVGVAKLVLLYASPVHGSAVASAINSSVGLLPRIRYFFTGHLRELRRGAFCDRLISAVVNHLYRQTVAPGDANYKVDIPIKACVGQRDSAVQRTSAEAFFENPGPTWIAGASHTSVKEPLNRGDLRYRALQQPLSIHFSEWFRVRAHSAVITSDPLAYLEISARCLEPALFRLRQYHPKWRAADSPDRIHEFLSAAMELAISPTATRLSFASVFDRAMQKLNENHR